MTTKAIEATIWPKLTALSKEIRRIMKYYRYCEANLDSYYEEDDGCLCRQIDFYNGEITASNINHPKFGPTLGEFSESLAEQENEVDGLVQISKDEFDAIWQLHLERHQPQWEIAKAQYPPGTPVVGAILVFYPKGVLVGLGPDTVGIADYAQCESSANPKWMYPKHKVKAIAAGYDEENQWILLEKPQVLGQIV